MGITGFGPPLLRRWQIKPEEATKEDEFVAECLRLWDRKLDTKDISVLTHQQEAAVERAVRFGRERRREKEARDEKDDF